MGSRSAFLFGPRAVGKSTLLRVQFPEARVYDLLDARVYGRLLRDAHLLEEETAPGALIIVDEIQKLPALLDEVHRLIVSSERRFVLTGSSARKLKRGASNLLAGRARLLHLFPLVSAEIPHFELETYLDSGGLPLIHGDTQARQDLRSYVDLYLREEIQAEALTRNVAAFGRVLDALGVSNGQELNAAAVASDVGAQARTVLNYVEILEDTLLGFRLPAYALRGKRKSTARPKFYLFDVGVAGALAGRSSVRESPEAFGRAFEHFILLELRAALSYARRDDTLSFWRTSTGFEVDAIFGDGRVAIECKATTQVGTTHLKGLRAFREEARPLRCIVVSRDPHPRRTDDGIEILPWRNFLQEVWSGALWE
jgi:predicted AAA+ superfamily ATPase